MAKSDPQAVPFRDKAFKSRTIVLSSQHCFLVECSQILATEPVLIDFLDKHPDFERVEASDSTSVTVPITIEG